MSERIRTAIERRPGGDNDEEEDLKDEDEDEDGGLKRMRLESVQSGQKKAAWVKKGGFESGCTACDWSIHQHQLSLGHIQLQSR